MKEKLYTIPLNDAFDAGDECPFCFIERDIEQNIMDFVLGHAASYMEADIRDITDRTGFCRPHFKKMFDYGNTLGNAWILKTHYKRIIEEMQQQFSDFSVTKTSLKDKFRKTTENPNAIGVWIKEKTDSCYICKQFEETYPRYMDTFFHLYKHDPAFVKKFENCKGFCLPHFRDLCRTADQKLSNKEKEDFYACILPMMEANMKRVAEDVAWMVEKFDYLNKDADWKNSKDAIQRGMQKLKGGYPADPVYKMKK